MILTSRRCFLNVMTQLMDKDTLLNANYFICDAKDNRGDVIFNDNIRYDSVSGEVITSNNIYDSPIPSTSQYNIFYSNESGLNPEVYMTTLISQSGEDPETSVLNAYKHELAKESTLNMINNTIFNVKLKGNKIQVLLFYNDSTIVEFGDLICHYLSYNFGVDILFVDACCRNNVKGSSFYQGNKERGKYISDFLRDYNLDSQIQLNSSSTTNLNVWLSQMSVDDLLYIYNKYSDIPFPPGDYTKMEIVGIVSSRLADVKGITDNNDSGGSISKLLYSTQDVFNDVLNEYDNSETNEFEDKWYK